MRTLTIVMLLAACGADERGGESDAGIVAVVLPSSCETNAGCPAGYYCQKANAVRGSPAVDKCMRPCVDIAAADCSLPGCDYRPDAPTFRPIDSGFVCGPTGAAVEVLGVQPLCTGGYIFNAGTHPPAPLILRPWHSNDDPCPTWLNPPATWPYRF